MREKVVTTRVCDGPSARPAAADRRSRGFSNGSLSAEATCTGNTLALVTVALDR